MKCLVIGGTGTLGNELVRRLLDDEHEVTVFSRDELKQQEMRIRLPEARYVIGDIRDRASLAAVMTGINTVFHVAALKHVDVLEENPVEAIKTNILGTINVAESAQAARVKHVVFSSTDKAVLAINTYGMTKAISERYLLSLNARPGGTRFAVYRWGNVLGSRGSVIHSFMRTLREDHGVRITDPRMTRFWIHIEDAVSFMLDTYRDAKSDAAMIPVMKAAKVMDIADTMARILDMPAFTASIVGLRPGEKIHECLESNHEYCLRSDTCAQFERPELEAMLRRVMCPAPS